MDRATEKNAEHELAKLAGFAAPNRLKERLAAEVAMRKAAELEVRRRLALRWLVVAGCAGLPFALPTCARVWRACACFSRHCATTRVLTTSRMCARTIPE
jgi:hypothetical protein